VLAVELLINEMLSDAELLDGGIVSAPARDPDPLFDGEPREMETAGSVIPVFHEGRQGSTARRAPVPGTTGAMMMTVIISRREPPEDRLDGLYRRISERHIDKGRHLIPAVVDLRGRLDTLVAGRPVSALDRVAVS